MSAHVFATSDPHVLIVGKRAPDGTWFYAVSEPVGNMWDAEAQIPRSLGDDTVVFARAEADPSWRSLNLVTP